ncbi:MAG: CPBP family intramembrane metalloprotease [Mesorhizobium sp.]|nr:CPBP family intramembrane metalloprotease [Mesorhizobium sp.]
MRTVFFERYVDLARHGANSWLRFFLAFVTLAVLYVLAGAVFFVAIAPSEVWRTPEAFDAALATPLGLAATLLSVGWMWISLWIVLRLFHRRRLATVVGHDGWAGRRDLICGLLVGLFIPLAAGFATLPIGPIPVRAEIALESWLLFSLPFAAIILIQASAEEAVFRGYFPQILASRGLASWIWFGLPTLLFAVIHWRHDLPLWKNASIVASIAIFAIAMMILVIRTGRIAAASGAHWGNNMVALQFVGIDDDWGPVALFHLPPLTDPAWTPTAVGVMVVATIPVSILQLALLLHPRSPVSVVRPETPLLANSPSSV